MLKTFFGWCITRYNSGIRIDQETYANSVLKAHNMHESNSSLTPLAIRSDVKKRKPQEEKLNTKDH